MSEWFKAYALYGYGELVTELGGNPEALLRAHHIPQELLEDWANLIPFKNGAALFEHSAKLLRCPDFGLRLGSNHAPDILGALAIALRNCPTVGDALHCATRHAFGLTLTLEAGERRGTSLFRVVIVSRPQPMLQLVELAMASIFRIISLLSGSQLHPLSIYFSHPRHGPLECYHRVFACLPRFEAGLNGILLRTKDLALPVPGQNSELYSLAQEYLDRQFDASHGSTSAVVCKLIPPLLKANACSKTRVAENLAMHPRTLQRRLLDEGTSFEALFDTARAELAQHYLVQKHLPLGRIAEFLGYSHPATFTRSCQRWFGEAPMAARRRFLAAYEQVA